MLPEKDNFLWQALADELAGISTQLQRQPVRQDVTPTEIRAYLTQQYAFERAQPLDDIMRDVAGMLQQWNTHVTHPRYFGLFTPNPTKASVVADSLSAIFNPQLTVWSHSPAANEMERHVLHYLLAQFGMEPTDSFANFTTGGAEANQTAVIAALTHHFPHYGEDGLWGMPAQPLIYVSRESHDSFTKIAHAAGLGRKALRVIPARDDLKMDAVALEKQILRDLEDGFAPFMVIGTAGTTSAGVIDLLPALASICRQYKLWFHVDAAWGGGFVLSPKYKPLLQGIEQADSITCDAHKLFSVALGAGMFFCRHPHTIAQTFRVKASYMPDPTRQTTDNYTTTIQWSRRFIGLKLFMSMAEKGVDGYRQQIEKQAELGDLLRHQLRKNGWQILNDTALPVVCFTHPAFRGTADVHAFCERLKEQGEVWVSMTVLRGKMLGLSADAAPVVEVPALRACITNQKTTAEDVMALVACLGREMPFDPAQGPPALSLNGKGPARLVVAG